MVRFNVIASTPVYRPGGMDFYPMIVNREPLDVTDAKAKILELKSRGIASTWEAKRCR